MNAAIIDEARNLAILICPLPSQLEDGDAIERMPDDLLRAATMLGNLCDLLWRSHVALRSAQHFARNTGNSELAEEIQGALDD